MFLLQCPETLDEDRDEARALDGDGGPGQIALDVLDALYNRFLDYRTRRLGPSVPIISATIGHSNDVVRCAPPRLPSEAGRGIHAKVTRMGLHQAHRPLLAAPLVALSDRPIKIIR